LKLTVAECGASLDVPLEEAGDAPSAEEDEGEPVPPVELQQVAVFEYGMCTLEPADDDML
jgi:hypothetical protein